MNRSTLRTLILIFGLFTAIVHLVVLNIVVFQEKGAIDPLFTPNGIGYLVLLVAVLRPPSFLVGRETLVHVAFIAFVALTIIAFFIFGETGLGGEPPDVVGWITKIDEILLIIVLFLHLRTEA